MPLERYEDQVRLLVQILPLIAEERDFALKGGTAINLFYRDMPRLSVDIDLVFVPVRDRAESLAAIDAALERIRTSIEIRMPQTHARRISGGGGSDTRVLVRRANAEVKIETSPVTRGLVHPPAERAISEAVEQHYGFAEILVASFEDLYGGKLHAALDRQHPRDLYDVKLLYEQEGLTPDLFRTFLVYVASSSRPPHELLRPNLIELEAPFAAEFEGMTSVPVSVAELAMTRTALIDDINALLENPARQFLLSLHDAEPDFGLIGFPHAAELPAVRWKLHNLTKLKRDDPAKHVEQRNAIERLWAS